MQVAEAMGERGPRCRRALGTALLPRPTISPVPLLSHRPPRFGPGTSVTSPACAQEKTQNKGFPPDPSSPRGLKPWQEKGLSPLFNRTFEKLEMENKDDL